MLRALVTQEDIPEREGSGASHQRPGGLVPAPYLVPIQVAQRDHLEEGALQPADEDAHRDRFVKPA
jgi:hypothetical protein